MYTNCRDNRNVRKYGSASELWRSFICKNDIWKLKMKIVNFFETFSFVELSNFKRKRVAAFRKNLIEMSELEIKHARVSIQIKPTTL